MNNNKYAFSYNPSFTYYRLSIQRNELKKFSLDRNEEMTKAIKQIFCLDMLTYRGRKISQFKNFKKSNFKIYYT